MTCRMLWPGLLLVLSTSIHALNPSRLPTQYIYDHYTRSDGLPAGAVWTLVQDASGYLWLGTQNGLARFDGVRFRIFDASNTPGLSSQDIRSIVIDPSGQLWLGSYGGGVFRFNDGQVESIGLEQGLPHNVIYDLLVDDQGALWIGTAGGLARRDQDGTMQVWTDQDGLSFNRVFRLYQDRDQGLWLATFGGGLTYFDGQTFTHYSTADGLASDQVHAVYEDRAGRLLIGTYDGGFQEFKDGRFFDIELPEGLAGLAIQSILEDGNNNLWLGAYGNGLIRYREGDVAHLNFAALEQSVITDMIEDAEGSLWLASREGLQRLRDGKVTVFGQAEGMSDTTFVVTGNPATNEVWVGTEGRGLFRLTDQTLSQFTQADHGLASNNISALTLASNGDLWAGSFGAGINRLSNGVVDVFGQPEGLPSDHVFALQIDRNEHLWVASAAGISVLDGGVFSNFGVDDGLPAAAIRQLFEDRSGSLWIGSNGRGLVQMVDGQIITPAFNSELPGSIVHAFHQDQAGRLWLGFRDGGLGLLINEERVFSFGTEQGLPAVSVNAIQQDREGFLWLATGTGLIRASMDELLRVADGRQARIEPMILTEADGLRSVQFAGGFQPTSWQDASGVLWFASTGGLVRVDPDQLDFNDRPPPVRIENLIVDGIAHAGNQPIELAPDTVNVEINYTGLSLVSPEQVQFRYRLLGYDRDWQDVGGRRTAYFTGLPKGEYEFQVLARNNDGVWSPAPAQLMIIQRGRFYEQLWFIALCLLAAGLLIAVVIRFWLASYRLREQRLSDQVRERTLQLERALDDDERASRIDGLTGVANRRYFEERLNRAWNAAVAEGQPLGLLMIDIDRFKRLNDTHGHQTGDDALRCVAQTLTESVHRSGDLVARFGGEEFVILLPGASMESVAQMAEDMRQAVASLSDADLDSPVPAMTISLGGASITPAAGLTSRDLIGAADDALYRAKRHGRNRVEMADCDQV